MQIKYGKIGKNIIGDYMKHEIDLKNYRIRTDLAIDSIDENSNLEDVVQNKHKNGDIEITDVFLGKNNNLGKKEGNYITIEFQDVTDSDNREKVEEVLIDEIKKMLKKMKIKKNDSCLIIGLGNEKSTPDSLGPLTINNVIVTNHLFLLGDLDKGYRRVSALVPGVMGQTGIDTSDIILSVINTLKPDFLIAIDALASQSIERVNKTIQMTDTGIHPGSGIGNKRKEISYDTIGIPVLAIGVPTVVDASVIVADTINYMYKHYVFNKEYIKNPKSKLTFNNINYLKKEIKISKNDKKNLLGLIGTLDDDEIKELIYEVLTPIGYNLMVTPKEVDFVMDKLSLLISNSLNSSLHSFK